MARTPGAGTITQALIDTQLISGRKPYIKIFINSTDYFSRLLYIEHHEEAYRDRAVIGLSNRDNALDSLDLDGKEFEIGYGYDTTAQGGSSTDKVDTATLWVKSHQIISIQGERIYQIYAEGMWMYLRERKVIAGLNIWQASRAYIVGEATGSVTPNGHRFLVTTAGTSGASEPSWDTASGATTTDGTVTWTENGLASPYTNTFNATHTVYGLIELIIEGALGWTLEDTPPDDGIIDTFKPVFDINQLPFENAAALLYRLIWMTKEYFRPRKSKTIQMVFPQTSDSVDETYYSFKAHWFSEYTEKSILLIPNSIIVLCNQDPNSQWATDAFPLITGTATDSGDDPSSFDDYGEVIQVFLAGNIRTQADADRRAAAILTRYKSEILGGRLIIPHDAQVELFDKIKVSDGRGL